MWKPKPLQTFLILMAYSQFLSRTPTLHQQTESRTDNFIQVSFHSLYFSENILDIVSCDKKRGESAYLSAPYVWLISLLKPRARKEFSGKSLGWASESLTLDNRKRTVRWRAFSNIILRIRHSSPHGHGIQPPQLSLVRQSSVR